VRRLTKKVRQIERLEIRREGGAPLTAEEKEKVDGRAQVDMALAKATKRLTKLQRHSTPVGGGMGSSAPSTRPSGVSLAQEYLELAEAHGVPLKTVVFHVRRMAKQELTRFQLLSDVLAVEDVAGVRALLETAAGYEANGCTPLPPVFG
jgi:hypothetical protein